MKTHATTQLVDRRARCSRLSFDARASTVLAAMVIVLLGASVLQAQPYPDPVVFYSSSYAAGFQNPGTTLSMSTSVPDSSLCANPAIAVRLAIYDPSGDAPAVTSLKWTTSSTAHTRVVLVNGITTPSTRQLGFSCWLRRRQIAARLT